MKRSYIFFLIITSSLWCNAKNYKTKPNANIIVDLNSLRFDFDNRFYLTYEDKNEIQNVFYKEFINLMNDSTYPNFIFKPYEIHFFVDEPSLIQKLPNLDNERKYWIQIDFSVISPTGIQSNLRNYSNFINENSREDYISEKNITNIGHKIFSLSVSMSRQLIRNFIYKEIKFYQRKKRFKRL